MNQEQLLELARLCQLETSYYDGIGNYREAPPEAVLEVLKALGIPLEDFSDVPEALRIQREQLSRQFVEPVFTRWDDAPFDVALRIPAENAHESILCDLELESGEHRRYETTADQLPLSEVTEVEGARYETRVFPIQDSLPNGYHDLHFEMKGQRQKALLIASPKTARTAPPGSRSWGVFLPLYSLRSRSSWGGGDFEDLNRFTDWIAERGGTFVGMLPLMPAFLDAPLNPSPYAPVSRFFWNEYYIDPTRTVEWESCNEARGLYGSAEFQKELSRQRERSLVDYRQQMRLKRSVLEKMAHHFFRTRPAGFDSFERYRAAHPRAEGYASFRAVHERIGKPWHQWPDEMRRGRIQPSDYDEQTKNYFLYTQWVATRQLHSATESSRGRKVGLYLDLPLGVHPDGYDVWSEQGLFTLGISGGAPPDAFFTAGQMWGFPPLHPEECRRRGYRYTRESLRHLLSYCDLLRIDHVMSLHRLFWVPNAMTATSGVYVHYRPEEFYAILNLESHRRGCIVVGEDLGTVPPEVRKKMDHHQIYRMYVGQFEVRPDSHEGITATPERVIASINTHDTPTFAGFWQGLDIEYRVQAHLLDEEGCEQERANRRRFQEALMRRFGVEGDPEDSDVQHEVLRKWLAHLGAGSAQFLLINLEDLWLETAPQNVPGTTSEHPNWRRKARYKLEDLCKVPGLLDTLDEIRTRRSGKAS